MRLDKATMTKLELLLNIWTGRAAHSLARMIKSTKMAAGGQMLRTDLMVSPTRLDMIRARLDLVDTWLEDTEFLYVVIDHLKDLPDVDRRLAYVSLAPRRRESDGGANH
jgi:DNA mismatch repair ATPase MutS